MLILCPLSLRSLTMLATLCGARADDLREMIADGEMGEDETAEAEMDITYLIGLADMFRRQRGRGLRKNSHKAVDP